MRRPAGEQQPEPEPPQPQQPPLPPRPPRASSRSVDRGRTPVLAGTGLERRPHEESPPWALLQERAPPSPRQQSASPGPGHIGMIRAIRRSSPAAPGSSSSSRRGSGCGWGGSGTASASVAPAAPERASSSGRGSSSASVAQAAAAGARPGIAAPPMPPMRGSTSAAQPQEAAGNPAPVAAPPRGASSSSAGWDASVAPPMPPPRDASRPRRPGRPVRRAADRACGALSERSPPRAADPSVFQALGETPKASTDAGEQTKAAAIADQTNAKAKAVAALQRLFFQELKVDNDPNAAAARALRRLGEQTADAGAASPSTPDVRRLERAAHAEAAASSISAARPPQCHMAWEAQRERQSPAEGVAAGEPGAAAAAPSSSGGGEEGAAEAPMALEGSNCHAATAMPPAAPVGAAGRRRPNSLLRRHVVVRN